jgi:PKD repeat protein
MKRRDFTVVQLSLVCIAVLFILPVAATTLPVAGFVSNVTSGTTPLHVKFTDVSVNSPTEWIWSFGDGDTSTAQNPSHTYTQAGTYTVTLAATNSGGSNTVSMIGYVTVEKAILTPVALFVSNVTSGTEPVAVQFLDISTNSPTSEVWEFGDGSISTGPGPSHIYTNAGVYTVTLTATNAAGSNTITRTGYITVGAPVNGVPVARFVSTVNSGTVPRTVQFIDASTNFPVSWVWSFGDGDISTAQNPLHIYNRTGTYTVTLTATNAGGNHTVTKDNYITVSYSIPVASFVSTPASGTAPLYVQFKDTSTNSPASWDWTFGDGGTSTMQSPAYVYTVPGVYTVSFSAINGAGKGTVIRSDYVSVSAISPPLASFTSDVSEGTTPLTIRFTDGSTNSPTSWEWTFGDGTGSSVKNPSHTYTGSGSYTVTLMATNAGGSHILAMKDYITVSEPVGTAVTTIRKTAVPTSSSATTTVVPMAAVAVTQVPNPIVSAIDMSSGIIPLALILVPLSIAGVVIIWSVTRPPKRPGRQRGRDL